MNETTQCTAFGTGCGGTVTDGICGTCGGLSAPREARFNEDFWTKHNSDRSQDRISDNEAANKPCCMACGRFLADMTKAKTVHIVSGGSTVLHPEDEALFTDHAADMGFWNLGPECAKMFPAEYRRPLSV